MPENGPSLVHALVSGPVDDVTPRKMVKRSFRHPPIFELFNCKTFCERDVTNVSFPLILLSIIQSPLSQPSHSILNRGTS